MLTHQLISPQQAIRYVQHNTEIFNKNANLIVDAITTKQQSVDGYVNMIHLVKDVTSGKSVAFKQVLPYVRAAKEEGVHTPLSPDRMKIEIAAFQIWESIYPEVVPQIYWQDEENAILIMEDLSRMKLLRFGLTRMKRFPILPEKIGTFLGKSAFYTSDLYLDPVDKKRLVKAMTNPEFRALFERFIFCEPFFEADRPINPRVKTAIVTLQADNAVLAEVLTLKDAYATQAQALIHSDLHTSNICINQCEMKVFDAEGAFFGPVAFDVGRLLGNIVLNYASWEGVETVSSEDKQQYRRYLLQLIEQIYHQFEQTFSAAWSQHVKAEYRRVEGYKEIYLGSILRDAVGFAGCIALARIYDGGECYDFQQFNNLDKKAIAQKLVFKFVRNLLLKRHEIKTIEDFTNMIEQTHTEYVVERLVWKSVSRLDN